MPAIWYQTRLDISILFADYLYKHPLAALAVKLAIKDLFPRPEIKLACGNSNYDLSAHDSPLQVRVGVVLAG
jgi:hypothetical protein